MSILKQKQWQAHQTDRYWQVNHVEKRHSTVCAPSLTEKLMDKFSEHTFGFLTSTYWPADRPSDGKSHPRNEQERTREKTEKSHHTRRKMCLCECNPPFMSHCLICNRNIFQIWISNPNPKILVFTSLYIQQVGEGRACICAERHEKVNQPLCLRLNLRIAAQCSCNRARLPLRLTAHYHRTAPKDPPAPSPACHPSQHDLASEVEPPRRDA